MELEWDVADLLDCMSLAGMKYLIVGNRAIAYHGMPTHGEGRMEVLIENSAENGERFRAALKHWDPYQLLSDYEALTVPMESLGQLELNENTIDFHIASSAVEFESSYNRRKVVKQRCDGRVLEFPIMCKADLETHCNEHLGQGILQKSDEPRQREKQRERGWER